MGLFGFFERHEDIVAVDVGSSGLKVLQVDIDRDVPTVLHWGVSTSKGDIFANYAVSRPDLVAHDIIEITEKSGIKTKFCAVAVPGPSVFTKRIKMPSVARDELQPNIQMEAANFIPHNIDAVKLDFHVIGDSGKNQIEVLVAAAKTEVIESFSDSTLAAGIEALVVDVEHFAVQNSFEVNYPELLDKTVALVNIGARYASVNICQNGCSLFTGDISIGGRAINETLASTLGIGVGEAESKKRAIKSLDSSPVAEALRQQVDALAVELNRQLSFFWNASGAENGIDQILLSGGCALLTGLCDSVAHRTGIPTVLHDPFKVIDCSSLHDAALLRAVGPSMAVAAGLSLRRTGDKIFPDE